jgi:hypothetical protein
LKEVQGFGCSVGVNLKSNSGHELLTSFIQLVFWGIGFYMRCGLLRQSQFRFQLLM